MTTISSIDALYAQNAVAGASKTLSESVENLTTGVKQNANVADLAVSTILASRVTTLRVAINNAGQANSLLKTAKGAMDTIINLLKQQKSLATKASDASLSDNERGFLSQQFVGLAKEIDSIATYTNFNGIALLDGSISGSAGASTATGVSTEHYSLINSSQFSVSGAAVAGDAVNIASAVAATNILTFGKADAANAAGTATVTFADADGKFGSNTKTNTFTYAVTNGQSAVDIAAAFVAAANAQQALDPSSADGATGNNLVRQFNFIDNKDGTVQVVARNATADVNGITIGVVNTATSDAKVYLGKGGANGGAEISAAAGAIADGTAAHQGVAGVSGALSVIQASNVAKTASTNKIHIGSSSAAGAGETRTIKLVIGTFEVATISNSATLTAQQIANELVTQANASTADGARRFSFTSDNAGNITVTNNELGATTAADAITFNITDTSTGTGGSALTATMGTNNLVTGNAAFNSGSDFHAGETASVSDSTQTYDANLLGSITGMAASFTTGTSGANNTVQFTAIVGGETYKSQVVNLYGANSDTILANTKLTFTNIKGAVDSSGASTGPAFQILTSSTAISGVTGQSAANTLATKIQTQVAPLTINQSRSLNLSEVSPSTGNYQLKSTIGTVLQGLVGFNASGDTDVTANAAGDIQISGNQFTSTGTNGSFSSFSVNRSANTITTTLNGQTYTAYLNSSNFPSAGGVTAFGTDANGQENIGTYDSSTKVLNLLPATGVTNNGNQAKLIFYSSSITDANTVTVNLGNVSKNVSNIDISTEANANALADALNKAFNVAANDSLSFQVGATSDDAIGVSIGAASTSALYTDSTGASKSISITTLENAQEAADVLDNAINNITALEADVLAAITSFNAAIQNGNASAQNADAARSALIDTDYTEESTNFAEARVRVDAATAVLAQLNQRAQGLLTLLRQ
jgi:flagellin